MNTIIELTERLSKEILNKERRTRSLISEEQVRFDYALKYFIIELWKSHFTHPDNQCFIQRRSIDYSKNQKYLDPILTYEMVMVVLDGLINLDMIFITKVGCYDRTTFESGLTRFRARPKLIEMLEDLEGHPVIYIKPNLVIETIIICKEINGIKLIEDYEETSFTDKARKNLRTINGCFARHWLDLMIKDKEVIHLQEMLIRDDDKNLIDLTKKVLVRVFFNNNFKEGGKFFRGWWQHVPSEYRPYITIDSKRTQEYDFSQLNPNMIYSLYNLEMGSEDAYGRVLDGEHLDIVKKAFKAMIESSTGLNHKPKGIDLDKVEMTWNELKQAILNAHKPIQYLFFKGKGNALQFEESAMTEGIMLHFAEMDTPTLAVNDSFIMQHGYASELEETMRRTFFDKFHEHIKVKAEIIEEIKFKNDNPIGHPKFFEDKSIELLLEGNKDYSGWLDRNTMWLKKNKTFY